MCIDFDTFKVPLLDTYLHLQLPCCLELGTDGSDSERQRIVQSRQGGLCGVCVVNL